MKSTIKSFVVVLFALAMLSSCDNQKSVQEYYVEKQESNNFIALDLPASIVSLDEGASEETRETMKTIKKLNILAFKIDESNRAEYDKEYAQVREILKSDKYNELMRMKHKGMNVVINYQGSDEAVDEFILLASDNTKGFALARVLGDKMKPAQIMKMAEDMKNIDADGSALAELGDIFSDLDID